MFQNIFLLAKVSFAKGKMLGAGWHPTGPEWGRITTFMSGFWVRWHFESLILELENLVLG